MKPLNKAQAPTATATRRGFLAGVGGLTFSISLVGQFTGDAAEASTTDAPAKNLTVWVRVSPDDEITILNPATEMGQGSMTALPLMFAEEFDADWSKVRIEYAPPDGGTYGYPGFEPGVNIMMTTGSIAVLHYYSVLRKAGARARQILLMNAARHMDVPMAELTTEPSVVVHTPSGRRMSYGEVAKIVEAAAEAVDLGDIPLKSERDFRLIGRDTLRRDFAEKLDGKAMFACDVHLPNMLNALIRRTPVAGESPVSFDRAEIEAMDGVDHVIALAHGVAVVGQRIEALFDAHDALDVEWSGDGVARGFDSDQRIVDYADLAEDEMARRDAISGQGDIDTVFARSTDQMHAEFRTDHMYHAQLEPMNAVARPEPDSQSLEIWAGTQAPTILVRTVAAVTGVDVNNITLNRTYLGGGFGRRTMPEDSIEAAVLALQLGRPVKVIWTRTDDMQNGAYRAMTYHRLSAAFDDTGALAGWHHRIVSDGGRLAILGMDTPYYDIANKRVDLTHATTGVRLKDLRSVSYGPHKFAIESFIDELAANRGLDSLDFRRALMADHPRALHVVNRAAEMAGWGTLRDNNRALGIGFSEHSGSPAACVVEISVDRTSGQIRVHHVWAAIDCGLAVQPENVRTQMEGGIIMGLSSNLLERLTFKDGAVQQSNYHDYPIMRMRDIPDIDVDVISGGGDPTGVGESGMPITGGAIANAFAALTGKRLRHLPFTPERVLAALSS